MLTLKEDCLQHIRMNDGSGDTDIWDRSDRGNMSIKIGNRERQRKRERDTKSESYCSSLGTGAVAAGAGAAVAE